MEKKIITKETIISAINKMVSNKKDVRDYIKGKVDFKTLENKGIKFAKPL